MIRRFTLLLLLSWSLTGTSDSVQAAERDVSNLDARVKPVRVPFKLLRTGHFLVEVKLNGKGPYQLIFDTGAPTMLINNRIANASGVIDPNAVKPFFAPFGSRGQFNIKQMQIGELKAADVKTMVLDHPTVQLFSDAYKNKLGGRPIDGIVGFPFFARFRMTVDYQAKEMSFVPNGYEPGDAMMMMMRSLLGSSRSKTRKLLIPAAQWGLVVSKDDDDDQAGVIITAVRPNSPTAKAGLQKGDRLLTIDGRWTDSVSDTYKAASYVEPGESVPVKVRRGDQTRTVQVTPSRGL